MGIAGGVNNKLCVNFILWDSDYAKRSKGRQATIFSDQTEWPRNQKGRPG